MANQAASDFGPSGLASLSITGLRRIGQLRIPRLGRVLFAVSRKRGEPLPPLPSRSKRSASSRRTVHCRPANASQRPFTAPRRHADPTCRTDTGPPSPLQAIFTI